MKKLDRKTKAILAYGAGTPLDVINNLSPDVINNLSPDVINNLSPYVINNLSPDVINNLSPYVINNLSPYVIKNLSPDVINNLSPDVINNLSPYVINNLSPDVINNLSPDVINNLSPDVINNLSPYVINNLSPDVINNLSPDVINNLSPDVINNLSPESLAALKDYNEMWEKIPVLIKPYTRLLEDIQNKKRIHNQSTFGPEDCIPENNVCGTAMCTAGHLVNMAGAYGYELKAKFGWGVAAMMIHKKTHPDYPVQNFGNIPQDWALAYIEEMAEMEGAENGQTHNSSVID